MKRSGQVITVYSISIHLVLQRDSAGQIVTMDTSLPTDWQVKSNSFQAKESFISKEYGMHFSTKAPLIGSSMTQEPLTTHSQAKGFTWFPDNLAHD